MQGKRALRRCAQRMPDTRGMTGVRSEGSPVRACERDVNFFFCLTKTNYQLWLMEKSLVEDVSLRKEVRVGEDASLLRSV